MDKVLGYCRVSTTAAMSVYAKGQAPCSFEVNSFCPLAVGASLRNQGCSVGFFFIPSEPPALTRHDYMNMTCHQQ